MTWQPESERSWTPGWDWIHPLRRLEVHLKTLCFSCCPFDNFLLNTQSALIDQLTYAWASKLKLEWLLDSRQQSSVDISATPHINRALHEWVLKPRNKVTIFGPKIRLKKFAYLYSFCGGNCGWANFRCWLRKYTRATALWHQHLLIMF